MSVRVLLIGRSGFVGSNLLTHLQHPNVCAPSENEADLTQPDSLRRVLQPGDIVLNAAGYANATDKTERGAALFRAINVDGLRNLAQAAAEAGAAHLVHISSVAAMGRLRCENVTEEMHVPVESPYAESKLEGERILAEYMDKLPVTIIRPTSVFGEGRGLARNLCKLASKGTIPLPGGGKARIPFTYVGNVARGVETALGNPKCFGRTFIVGDAQSYRLRDILVGLARELGVKPRIIWVPVAAARAGVSCLELAARLRGSTPILDSGRLDTLTHSVSYSIAAFREAAGYEPPYSLQDAIKRVATWYNEAGEK